jgi:hypothetical protein
MEDEMIWSIFDSTDGNIENWVEDRRAIVGGRQLEDGIHVVRFTHFGVQTSASVVVSSGEFQSTTDNLIGNAVKRAGYWGEYIEGFFFNDDGQIEVVIGS